MHFTFHSASFISMVLLKCVSSAPYGFTSQSSGRQQDAIVIDAAPSFSPVSSGSGYPAHNPASCRHRIHYTPSSYSSGTNTRQSYQQLEPMTYQPFHNPGVVRIRQNAPSDNYETYRTPLATVESPKYFQRQNNGIQESPQINQYDHEQSGSSYEAFMVQQGYPSGRMVMGYRLMASSSAKPKLSSSYF